AAARCATELPVSRREGSQHGSPAPLSVHAQSHDLVRRARRPPGRGPPLPEPSEGGADLSAGPAQFDHGGRSAPGLRREGDDRAGEGGESLPGEIRGRARADPGRAAECVVQRAEKVLAARSASRRCAAGKRSPKAICGKRRAERDCGKRVTPFGSALWEAPPGRRPAAATTPYARRTDSPFPLPTQAAVCGGRPLPAGSRRRPLPAVALRATLPRGAATRSGARRTVSPSPQIGRRSLLRGIAECVAQCTGSGSSRSRP